QVGGRLKSPALHSARGRPVSRIAQRREASSVAGARRANALGPVGGGGGKSVALAARREGAGSHGRSDPPPPQRTTPRHRWGRRLGRIAESRPDRRRDASRRPAPCKSTRLPRIPRVKAAMSGLF